MACVEYGGMERWKDRQVDIKRRQDLLKEDNEGVIKSEIAYRLCSTSSPNQLVRYCIKWYMPHTYTQSYTKTLTHLHGSGRKWKKK